MKIYLVILPEDKKNYERKNFHLLKNIFYDKNEAKKFLDLCKNMFPDAKFVSAELKPELSSNAFIHKNRLKIPENSVININENPDLESRELDYGALMQRLNLQHHFKPAPQAALRERPIAQPPIPDRAPAVPAAAASPSPAPNNNRGAILRAAFAAQFPAPSPEHARGLPDALPELKSYLIQYLGTYITSHARGELRREIAKQAFQDLTAKGKDMNPEEFKKFLQDAKKEIEKTPDHKASGLWRIFEETIKKVDLQFLAVQNPNNNLVTQRFPFINESHLEKARQLDLVCPISGSIMDHPVKVLPSGKHYDKSSIDALKASGAPFICSITRQPITSVLEAPEKKKEIEAFLQKARENQQNPGALAPPKALPPSGFRAK